jgi:uncharacterized protein (TIGR03083 family)
MTDTSFGSRYLATIERISVAAASHDPASALPACPGWSIQHLVAHLTGLAEDWTLSRLDGYAGDAWTAAQIARHGARPTAALLTMLRDTAAAVARLERHPVLGEPARWAFGDALIHEADLAEATGGAQPPLDDVHTHLSAGLERWSAQLARAEVRLDVDAVQRRWTVGADADDAVELSVVADAYEMWRCVYGRRTWPQFCELRWNRNPTELRDLGLPYPFTFASDPSPDASPRR